MHPGGLDIERIEELGRVRVVVRGELDIATAELLDAALMDLAGRRRTVVLDLSELGFIDSTGLTLLFRLHEHAGRNGWRLSVRSRCSRPVRRALEISRFDEILLDTDTAPSG